MVIIQEKSDTKLVLGPRRKDELIGLFLFGLGLLFLSIGLVAIIDHKRISSDQLIFVGMSCFYIVPMIFVGGMILFGQNKFVFDAEHGALIHLRWLRQPRIYKTAHFNAVVIMPTTEITAQLELVGDGESVRIGSGGRADCGRIATAINDLLGLPIQYVPKKNT